MYPKVAARSCEDCRRFMYDDKGDVLTRGGEPVKRPRGGRTPCATCPKVPAGTPSPSPAAAVELSEEHRQALRFYRECRATGEFPADPLVRFLAAAFRAAEDHCDKVHSHRSQLTVLSSLRGG